MGRSSSTGYPFLIQRSEVGQFTYNRDVPAHLAPLVVGDVLLAWCGRTRTLAGKGTVKISLGTGDEKTARQRWGTVHPQVDALVQMAEMRVRGPKEAASASAVPRLDGANVRRIAEQAYYDVLATDDRSQVEPGHATPMASLLLRLTRGSLPVDTDSPEVAERAARSIERRLHEGRLRRRQTFVLDQPIEETELDDAVLGVLLADVTEGDRLAPEQIEAVAHGIPIAGIPSEVDQRLKENGIDLPDGHVDRRAIALAITRAKLRALNDVAKRDRGAPIDTPERPASVKPAAAAPPKLVPLLSSMPERWITMARPGGKQVDDNARYVRLFIALHGDLPVDQIKGAHVRSFRDGLLECPRNAPKNLARASIADLAVWAKANPAKAKLSRGTINHKALGSLSVLMEQARSDEHIQANPVQGQFLPTKASDKQERRPYRVDELNCLVRTKIYLPTPRIPAGGGGVGRVVAATAVPVHRSPPRGARAGADQRRPAGARHRLSRDHHHPGRRCQARGHWQVGEERRWTPPHPIARCPDPPRVPRLCRVRKRDRGDAAIFAAQRVPRALHEELVTVVGTLAHQARDERPKADIPLVPSHLHR